MNQFSLSKRTLATGIIITLLLGYLVSLLQVYDRSHFNMSDTARYYRGDDQGEDSLNPPKSFSTLLSVAHVHSFSQPFIFAMIGFIFSFSSYSEKTKSYFITLGFLGTILSNLTPWLIRYVAGNFVYLFPLSQTMVAVSLLTMSFTSLKQLWQKD